MSNKKATKILSITSITLGTAAAFWLLRRRSTPSEPLSVWEKVLVARYGSTKAQQMVEQMRQRYTDLLAKQPLPENPILRHDLTGHILPRLALYQALLQEYGSDRKTALAEIETLFRAWLIDKFLLQMAILRYLPRPFFFFKRAFDQAMKTYPAEAWDYEYVVNNHDAAAYNVTGCYYQKILITHGAPELLASFCKDDDIIAELFPPSIRFVRTKTLGRGNEACDFQYYRVKGE